MKTNPFNKTLQSNKKVIGHNCRKPKNNNHIAEQKHIYKSKYLQNLI